MLHLKLTALKEKRGLTNQKIAERSKEPLSTVTRILNGETENPSYRTVVNIVSAMDGSLDEIEGIERPAEKTPEKVIELYERMVERQRRYIKFLFFSLLAIVVIGIIVAVAFDALHGSMGVIRY